MAEKKLSVQRRKTITKKKIIAKGIIHSISVRPKTTARKTTIRKKTLEKTIRSDTLTNRRGIYSNNLSNSKDMVKVKNYFKKQNQKCIKKDKPLYIFDLSRVSSKYIGETEKNLDRIFQRVKKMD